MQSWQPSFTSSIPPLLYNSLSTFYNLSSSMGTTIQSSPARLFSFLTRSHPKPPQTFPKNGPSVFSVLTRPASVTTKDNNNRSLNINTSNNTIATTSRTIYHDNWLESAAIAYITKTVQETTGVKTDTPGYKGLMMMSEEVFRKFSPAQQRQLIFTALEKAVPGFTLSMINQIGKLMPSSKFSREFFAVFTTIFFHWLVGPSEVRESEFEGKKEKNVVHITKCRFLEEANCVGMCTNLCKMPTQDFIKQNFGTPVTMVPNFDDLSCEMIFGQDPPAQEDDPAFKQPCYKLCNIKQSHSASCSS